MYRKSRFSSNETTENRDQDFVQRNRKSKSKSRTNNTTREIQNLNEMTRIRDQKSHIQMKIQHHDVRR